VHLRTTNPIESTFATVRHRTKITKGPGSRAAGLAMAFKLIEAAQDRWRALYWSRTRLLALNWAHAACRYSLISPASLARRWIWAGGTGKAMMSGSSFGARSSIPLPWWLRPVL